MRLFLVITVIQIVISSIHAREINIENNQQNFPSLGQNTGITYTVKPVWAPGTDRPDYLNADNGSSELNSTAPNEPKDPPVSSVQPQQFSGNKTLLITDSELDELSDALFRLDINNVAKYVTYNLQSKKNNVPRGSTLSPLLAVQESALRGPTFTKMMKLFDNYEMDVLIQEKQTPAELAEEEEFVDAVVQTPVMQKLREVLVKKGIVTEDPKSFKGRIRRIWFDLYSRQKGRVSSCGFEHVFLSELKNNEIIGLHNWVYFFEQEKSQHASYGGYSKQLQLGDKGAILKVGFKLDKVVKPVSNIFVGTSPELEMSLYSLCFLLRPAQSCPLRFGNSRFGIKAWPIRYHSKTLIGSAYPDI